MKTTALTLTRKEQECIHIGEDIIVWVDKTNKNKVQLTVHAPEEVNILRGELIEPLDNSNS